MKTVYFIGNSPFLHFLKICVVLISTTIVSLPQQWEWQNPLPQGNPLNSVYFIDSNTGWAVGDDGIILKTIDGGDNWSSQNPGSFSLNSVFFTDSNTGWVVGDDGTILKTTDGGVNWSSQASGTGYNLNSVYFTDNNTGWAVGDDGTILNTTNGGTNWNSQDVGTFALNSVYFTDSNTGWAVGSSGKILKTTDGGDNWSSRNPESFALNSVHFTDSNTGWVVGESGTMLKTTDGGNNWSSLNYFSFSLNSVYFTDNNTGWIVGSSGRIAKTTDGGISWPSQLLASFSLNYVYFTDNNTGWTVGEAGTILKTTNGGTNWDSQTSGTFNSLNSVYFTDSNTGWAVGESGTILTTTNGGDNWSNQVSGISNYLNSVYFTDSNTGWTVGESGTILKTTNGGANWSSQVSGTGKNLKSVYFIDSNTGWVAGDASSQHGGTILKTTNGGTNWVRRATGVGPTINLYSIYFTDSNNGWAVGDDGAIFRTYNGGDNWSSVNSGNNLKFVYFPDNSSGWAVGESGTILKYPNWSSQTSGTSNTLYSVHFTDSNTGWAVGENGTTLKTTNGGTNWVSQTIGTSNTLHSVYFTDSNTGWFVGENGTILHYSSGPGLTLTSPNGGENFYQGDNENITWTSSGITNVKLEYSTDNGGSWIEIAASTDASAGSYSWTVPGTPTTNALVRISDVDNASTNDESDAVFTINERSITVIVPNGGEVWVFGDTETINWSTVNVDNVDIEYSSDNGSSWNTIATGVSSVTPNKVKNKIEVESDNTENEIDGGGSTYNWSIPEVSTSEALVRITSSDHNSISDESDNTFTIIDKELILTSPNGGENWYEADTENITWTSTNITNVKLEYSTDNGGNWLEIAASTNASTGSYSWTVPGTPTTNALVRISDVDNASTNDESDAVFTINERSIIVLAPNGGENWESGDTETISWTTVNIDNVDIEYSSDNGNSWNTVATGVTSITPNRVKNNYEVKFINTDNEVDGGGATYSWVLPEVSTSQALVRITSSDYSSISDTSDNTFTILDKELMLTSPNGGENWLAGSTQNIEWISQDITSLDIEYSFDSGQTWNIIVSGTPPSLSSGSYNWAVPDSFVTEALIKITDVDDPSVGDTSDAVFSTYPANPVITTGDVSSYTGATISLPVYITFPEEGGSRGYQGQINYDADKFDFVMPDYGTGTLFNYYGYLPFFYEGTPGEVQFIAVSVNTPDTTSGVLFNLMLEIEADSSNSPSNITPLDFTGAQPDVTTFSYNSGTIDWIDPPPGYTGRGDANVDLAVTLDDGVLVNGHVNGNLTLTGQGFENADADLDGSITSNDVYYILYYIQNGNWPDPPNNAVGNLAINNIEYDEHLQMFMPLEVTGSEGIVAGDILFHYDHTKIGYQYFQSLIFETGGYVTAQEIQPGTAKFTFVLPEASSQTEPGKLILRGQNGSLPEGEEITTEYRLNGGNYQTGPTIIVGQTTGINEEEVIPEEFEVSQNYPNPFNPTTTIKYGLPEASKVTVKIYNMLGQEVKTLINSYSEAGRYQVNWNGDNDYGQKVASGAYIYRVIAGENVAVKKMILLK